MIQSRLNVSDSDLQNKSSFYLYLRDHCYTWYSITHCKNLDFLLLPKTQTSKRIACKLLCCSWFWVWDYSESSSMIREIILLNGESKHQLFDNRLCRHSWQLHAWARTCAPPRLSTWCGDYLAEECDAENTFIVWTIIFRHFVEYFCK